MHTTVFTVSWHSWLGNIFFIFQCYMMLVHCIVLMKHLKVINACSIFCLTKQVHTTFISSVTWCWMQPTERTRSRTSALGKKTSWKVLYSRPLMSWWWPLKTQIWISPGKVRFFKICVVLCLFSRRLPWNLKSKTALLLYLYLTLIYDGLTQ